MTWFAHTRSKGKRPVRDQILPIFPWSAGQSLPILWGSGPFIGLIQGVARMGWPNQNQADNLPDTLIQEDVMTWEMASSMLPLVQRIVEDLMASDRQLLLTEEKRDLLYHKRSSLDWKGRSDLYHSQDEIKRLSSYLRGLLIELEQIGITLLDAERGMIGFPTLVNNRRAFFTWKQGETVIEWWCYSCEPDRRHVPPAWRKESWRKRAPGANAA